MAWDNINQIFPSGYIITKQGDYFTNAEVIAYQFKTLSAFRNYRTRNMVTKQEEYIWGDNGEFALKTNNVLNFFPHVNNVAPLNVYGMGMLKDYYMNHPEHYPYQE